MARKLRPKCELRSSGKVVKILAARKLSQSFRLSSLLGALLALTSLVKTVLTNGGVDYCYSDIGCFPLSAEFFHPQHRPINLRPWHRRHIRTQFELFNRAHPEGYMLTPWDKFNLAQSHFNPKLETKIIIPGWLDNINRALWVRKLKDSLLWMWSPVNIIVVRWRNFTPYTIATANSRVVGAELANLIKFIESQMNYDRAYYHVIGHSLGAHIAGYCGDRIYGLGRITALDPARPFFQGMPKSVRLDRGDAKFVDAIHSDFTPENAILLLMSYGMTTPVGHLDFYPNGPPLFQPGCLRDTLQSVQNGIARGLEHNSLSIAFLEAVRYLTACDHQRSHEWFIESVTNRQCAFVGVRCNEFEGLINGRCTCDDSPSACAIMGIHADQAYLNNVHEELWPVRAGSIEYKYNKRGRAPRQPEMNSASSGGKYEFMHPKELMTGSDPSLAAAAAAAAYDQQMLVQHQLYREQVYAQLKHEARRLQQPAEPSILLPQEQEQQEPEAEVDPHEAQASDLMEASAPAEYQQQQFAAIDDLAFVEYLRVNLLSSQLTRESSSSSSSSENLHRRSDNNQKRPPTDGHPLLVSNLNRDIENWYEDNSKWFLKTNNRSPYCANQYQLMIFLGALETSNGRDTLRANLLVSIVGSRGQLLNQRFVPRGSVLTSHTMQPFFILLEGSYSLGQIKSVSLAWEARNERDPVKATVKFKSSTLEAAGSRVPAYLAKQAPWLPETLKYDKTEAFQWPGSEAASGSLASLVQDQSAISGSATSGLESLVAAAATNLKAGGISGHYSHKYDRRRRHDQSTGGILARPEVMKRHKRTAANNKQISKRIDLNEDYEEDDDDDDLDRELPLADSVGVINSTTDDQLLHSDSFADPYFVPLVDLPEASQRQPHFKPSVEELSEDEQRLTVDLHNIDLHDDERVENTIVINQVIVSPVQASYGHYGRTAKTFCTSAHPMRSRQLKLRRDRTIKLVPSLVGACH